MDRKEYSLFVKELHNIFGNNHFYYVSETAYSFYKKKIPEYFYIVSNIEIVELYSKFDKVVHLKFSPFDYHISFKGNNLFIKYFDCKKKDPKLFLLEFSNKNSDPIIFNLFYDPVKEIIYDFCSIIHFLKNKLFPINKISFINILKAAINANNLSLNSIFVGGKEKKIEIFPQLDSNFEESISKEKLSNITLNNFFSLLYFSITGKGKFRNLIFLDKLNIFDIFIPELIYLKKVNQNKDYHPEGNAFEHSLLTVKNIESYDFALNLAALFHDIGKYNTEVKKNSANEPKFPFHSQVGAEISLRIIKRWEEFLNFYPELENKLFFLIKNHMNIGYIKNLENKKQMEILDSPYLSDLLKLFKADVKGSYNRLDRYKKVISFIKSKVNKI